MRIAINGYGYGRPREMFFVFEGCDGCGKTTQVQLLDEYVSQHFGRDVVRVREPGGTRLGEELRRILLDPGPEELAPVTELYLFLAARAHLVRQRIAPALAAGSVVISDRFLWSSAAYQGAAGEIEPLEILRLGRPAVAGAPVARTIVLDLEPELGLARSGGDDRMEIRGVEFQRQVRQVFLELARREPESTCVIDASGTPEEVHARVVASVRPLFEGPAAAGPP